MNSRGKRKIAMRQSRLGFSPLPSSSPVHDSHPIAPIERAARVTFDSPRASKRQRLDAPPTPVASSQHSSSKRRSVRSFITSSQQPISSASKRDAGANIISVDTSEDSSDEDVIKQEETPTRAAPSTTFRYDSESEDSPAPSPSPPPPPPPRGRLRRRAERKPPSEDDGSLSNGEDTITLPRHGTHPLDTASDDGRGTSQTEMLDDSDEDAVVTRPLKARKRRSSAERQDLQDDLEYLGTSSPGSSWKGGRTTSSMQRSAGKRAALEALKKRRQQSSQPSSQPQQIISSDESSSSDMDDDEDFLESRPLASIAPANEEDEDFLDDDDDGDEVGDGKAFDDWRESIQLKTAKPKELFKFVIEWMVYRKIFPGFNRDAEKYRIAFLKTQDYTKGLAGSKFTSSAWTAQFYRSLNGRPQLSDYRFINDGILHDKCDACNRTGHPATWEVKFEGPTYNAITLEEDSEDEAGDEIEEGDGVVPPADKTYYIGKTCMHNARTAHALHHWKYHLNTWVVQYLEEEGHLKPSKIVKRDSWPDRKRADLAEQIMANMEKNGDVLSLYKTFKHETETAQNHNASRYGGYDSD